MRPKINHENKNSGNFTRRGFFSSCAACGVCLAAAPMLFTQTMCTPGKKMRIRVLYSLAGPVHTAPRAWPNIGFDFSPAMEQINAVLTKNFPDFEFFPQMASGPEDTVTIIENDGADKIDGYIVYQMELWNKVVQTVAQTGKPVLYADFQYGGSGGFERYVAAFIREQTPNVGFVSSSNMADFVAAVNCFNIIRAGGTPSEFAEAIKIARIKSTKPMGNYTLNKNDIQYLSPEECISRLKKSKILAVLNQEAKTAEPIMNIPLEYITFAEIDKAWREANRDEAAVIADRWSKSALDIVDVSQETLLSSAAMYLGMKSVLKKHDANAITINCLGGFTGEHIHAYPCLGFMELCNEGIVGACECDIRSTATMLAFSTLTNGRPGFISDPVIDTSKRQIIYAHCVAPTKIFGPQGEPNPFSIMTHSEDRKGASVRSVLPLNYMTTTLQIRHKQKEILMHQGVLLKTVPTTGHAGQNYVPRLLVISKKCLPCGTSGVGTGLPFMVI